MTSSLDPQGKRALFESPVAAPPEVVRPGAAREGRSALFSAGPPEVGTVRITCSNCAASSRVSLGDAGLRMLGGWAFLPGRRRDWWIRCPACNRRTWCSIAFRENRG